MIEADAQVASEKLCAFERKPERMMNVEASEVEELQAEPDFKKERQDMACLYRDARKNELESNVDKYGGFGLFNKTGKRIKPRLQPLDDPVGVQKEIPAELQGQISDFSVIVGSSVQKKEHVLLGSLRSCSRQHSVLYWLHTLLDLKRFSRTDSVYKITCNNSKLRSFKKACLENLKIARTDSKYEMT